jgi:lipopolysaccharide biosynthesis glycosyltransferase
MSKFLVYTCCFYQQTYVDIVSHLINSFENSGSRADFLVYTTTEYKYLIQKKCPNANILFFEKSFYKTMNQARIAKMDIFDYPNVDQYDKILYVDADSLFLKPPEEIFNQIVDDNVYAMGEGNLMNEGEYWGRSLFLKESADYKDGEGIASSVLAFKNLQQIKKQFIKIKQSFYLDMYQNKLLFYDQPFLNFHFLHNNMCNKEMLKAFVKSRPTAEEALKAGLTIVHFSGCPGHGDVKLDLIREFKEGLEKSMPKLEIKEEVEKSLTKQDLTRDTVFQIKVQLNELREKIAAIEALLA